MQERLDVFFHPSVLVVLLFCDFVRPSYGERTVLVGSGTFFNRRASEVLFRAVSGVDADFDRGQIQRTTNRFSQILDRAQLLKRSRVSP